jgi:hypothetical protein
VHVRVEEPSLRLGDQGVPLIEGERLGELAGHGEPGVVRTGVAPAGHLDLHGVTGAPRKANGVVDPRSLDGTEPLLVAVSPALYVTVPPYWIDSLGTSASLIRRASAVTQSVRRPWARLSIMAPTLAVRPGDRS